MNSLSISLQEDRNCYLGDFGFEEQMKHIVEPYLKNNCEQNNMISEDGTNLCYRIYQCETKKGKIFLIHGFSEFFDKYNELIYYFLIQGYSVYILELRGHGNSERKVKDLSLVHVNNFDEYVQDLKLFYENVFNKRETEFNDRSYLFGHSMGGAISALYIESYPNDFQKAILSSPMIRMKTGKFPFEVAYGYAGLRRILGDGEKYADGQKCFQEKPDYEHSSCSSKVRYQYMFRKRLEDINHQTWGASYNWVFSACTASKVILKKSNMKKISIPVCVLYAGNDHMVQPFYTKKFVTRCKYITNEYFETAKHEIFNENELIRNKFYEMVFIFFES